MNGFRIIGLRDVPDFLEPPKSPRRKRFEHRVSAERLAEYLDGQLEARRARWRAEHATHYPNKARALGMQKRRPKPAYVQWRRQGKAQRLLALPCWQVVAARMVAGQWYARRELCDLAPEYAETTVRCVVWLWLLPRGVIERTFNPEYDHGRAAGRQSEPLYLYRLTLEGVGKAVGWREALDEG